MDHESPQRSEHDAVEYEKPRIVDYGNLRELTAEGQAGTRHDGRFTHLEFS